MLGSLNFTKPDIPHELRCTCEGKITKANIFDIEFVHFRCWSENQKHCNQNDGYSLSTRKVACNNERFLPDLPWIFCSADGSAFFHIYATTPQRRVLDEYIFSVTPALACTYCLDVIDIYASYKRTGTVNTGQNTAVLSRMPYTMFYSS